jgi:hypothetical protein
VTGAASRKRKRKRKRNTTRCEDEVCYLQHARGPSPPLPLCVTSNTLEAAVLSLFLSLSLLPPTRSRPLRVRVRVTSNTLEAAVQGTL